MLVLASVVLAFIALLWLLMAAPFGKLVASRTVQIAASADHVRSALHPSGENFAWNDAVRDVSGSGDNSFVITTNHEDRDGAWIIRQSEVEDGENCNRFALRITDDSALSPEFWANYRLAVAISEQANGTSTVRLSETDSYRGLAFFVFRYFVLRRMASKLKIWAERGTYTKGGLFESAPVQFGLAALSTIVLWPLFGLTVTGLVMSIALTLAVALHELGHVAAFRMQGHRSARMIFIPLLGGLAIGSRPYRSHFEIAFAAMMGAGFSVFAVWTAVIVYSVVPTLPHAVSAALVFFILISGLFNLANLLPVWRFDGGQVLRQVFRKPGPLMLASAVVMLLFMVAALLAGMPPLQVFMAGLVITILSLVTGRISVKPRRPLRAMTTMERFAIVCGLGAIISCHATAVIWSWDLLLA